MICDEDEEERFVDEEERFVDPFWFRRGTFILVTSSSNPDVSKPLVL